jgi:tellurite resistance protein TerC
VTASALTWIAFVAFVAVAFVVDFRFFEPRDGSRSSVRRAVGWSVFWLLLAFGFAALVWATDGSKHGGQFITGYLLERSLSLDNVFVFALIFGTFAVPPEHRQRVLEFGIIGALVLRFVFIAVGAELIEAIDWVLYLFGAFLLYTGVKMAVHRHEEEQIDPDRNIGVRIVRRLMPVTDGYRGSALTVREGGRRVATPLLVVVVAVATADLIFAVDSIPAIFGITTDTFIVFSANAFALLGLRALYALLEHAQDRFVHLKTGLAFILVFIGAKMLLEWLVHIPVAISLGVIVASLAVAIGISMAQTRQPEPQT